MTTANYLRVVDSDHNAAKGAELNDGCKKGRRGSKRKEKPMKAYTYMLIN